MIAPSAPIRLCGWALVLGASSGFGAATALALAEAGLDVFGVHLDRRATLPDVARVVAGIEAHGRRAHFFNVNAADVDRRAEVVAAMTRVLAEAGQPGQLRVLLHSLAFGTLRAFITDDPAEAVTPPQMAMTLDVMAHSLVYWTQAIVGGELMGPGGRIFAMTSTGGAHALPSYGAVSAAKAALESHVRQLAAELAPRRITANAIRAGLTATPAAQKIPGYDALQDGARRRNPSGRLTTPDDVARAIVALSHEDTAWITGNVIGVDGGEDIVG
jgi:NAD(P)-dependent dehydrogenase (short-subunit alcohol dehydrogenase family)